MFRLLGFLFVFASCLQAGNSPVLNYLKPLSPPLKPSGLETIDAVYVINLDARPERWKRMEALLGERGVRPSRVSAVNGWQISEEMKKELSGPYPVRLLGGPIGCLLSHLSIYKDAKDRNLGVIWVLEDDADFIGDVKEIPELIKKLSKIDPNWDIFYTDKDCRDDHGGVFVSWSETGRPDQKLLPQEYYRLRNPVGEGLLRIRNRYGTTSMCLSPRGREKILDYFSKNYLWTAIDCDLHFIPGIRQYAPEKEEIVTNCRGDASSDTRPWSTLNPKR